MTVAVPPPRASARRRLTSAPVHPPTAGQTRSRTFEEAPGWEEALASDSEAIVKAERTSPKPFKQLQEETVEVIMEEDEAVEGGEDKGATAGAF